MPPINPNSKKKPRSHEDSVNTVCSVCVRKQKCVRSVSEQLEKLIQKHVYSAYSTNKSHLPKVICAGCRKTLTSIEKVRKMKRFFTKYC